MTKTPTFNAAGFLDHHWFENGINGIINMLEDPDHFADWKGRNVALFSNMNGPKTIGTIIRHSNSGPGSTGVYQSIDFKLIFNAIPDDILLFICKYIYPLDHLTFSDISDEEFRVDDGWNEVEHIISVATLLEHLRQGLEELRGLMAKYDAA
jgi:hypothetical protein